MKVWVVTITSYSPSYADDGYTSSTSVEDVFASKEEAEAFVEQQTADFGKGLWSPDFDIEEKELRGTL